MDKLIELGTEVIKTTDKPKPVLVMIGSILLAEKFESPEWLETINLPLIVEAEGK